MIKAAYVYCQYPFTMFCLLAPAYLAAVIITGQCFSSLLNPILTPESTMTAFPIVIPLTCHILRCYIINQSFPNFRHKCKAVYTCAIQYLLVAQSHKLGGIVCPVLGCIHREE